MVRSGIDGEMVVKGEDGKAINKATPVEDAIALIHLYGNQEQSNLASEYARMIGETNRGNATELVNALRKDIREMLGEPELVGEPAYLRVHLK